MSQKAVALIRVSSEEQAAEGLAGLERQQRDIQAIAARNGLRIAHTYRLEGISGSTVKLNPQFQRMLTHISSPEITGLVISSPDRLMRCDSLADLSVLSVFGNEARPRLIWAGETVFNLAKFESQILFVMQTLIGGHEKRQIIKRTQDGKNISRERGDKCPEKPPAGVEFIISDARNRTGFYRFTPAAERIKKAFCRVLDRDSSIKSIAAELGFRSYQAMRKQLINPIWTGVRESKERREKLPPGPNGELRYRRVPRTLAIRTRITLRGDPLISDEAFNQVQGILGTINKEHISRRSGKSPFELSGLLRCNCGQRYYSKHDTRHGRSGWYMCKSGYFDASKRCGSPHLARNEADDRIMGAVASVLGSKARLTELLKAATEPANSSGLRDERTRLRRQVEVQTKRKNTLMDKIADGLITDADARIKIRIINSEIGRYEDRIGEIDRKLIGAQIADFGDVVTGMVRLIAGLEFQPRERRKAVIRSLVSEIHIGPEKEVKGIRLKLPEFGKAVLLSIED